jgi:hypothetical protein
MGWMTRRMFTVVAAGLGLAAILGGTLGVAFAKTTDLQSGMNVVGGPTGADVQAKDWVSCIPTTSWASVYIWDAPNQRWLHYFNTASGVPAYVNQQASGGIGSIPRYSGVVVMMNTAVSAAKFPDQPNQACTS